MRMSTARRKLRQKMQVKGSAPASKRNASRRKAAKTVAVAKVRAAGEARRAAIATRQGAAKRPGRRSGGVVRKRGARARAVMSY
jgi:hypothetical protein